MLSKIFREDPNVIEIKRGIVDLFYFKKRERKNPQY